VGGFPVHTVPQGVIWFSARVSILEGKMVIVLSICGELDVVEEVEEVLQLFGSVGPDHDCHSCDRTNIWA